MRRTWIVTVGMSVGHEMHDCFGEMDVYGPYTKEQAEKLTASLNERYNDGESEHLEAVAWPLDYRSVRKVLSDMRVGE